MEISKNSYFPHDDTLRKNLSPQKIIHNHTLSMTKTRSTKTPQVAREPLVALLGMGVVLLIALTAMTISLSHPWDAQSHPRHTPADALTQSLQLNDQEAIPALSQRRAEPWQLSAAPTIAIQAPSKTGNLLSSDFDCRTLRTADFLAVGLPNFSYRQTGPLDDQAGKYKCTYRASNGNSLLIYQAAGSLESALAGMGKTICQEAGTSCTTQKLIINSYPAALDTATAYGTITTNALFILDPDEDEVIYITLIGNYAPQKLIAYAKAHVF